MNIVNTDKQYVWHPFTQMQGASDPIHIVSGDGIWLKDNKGNKYLDGVSSWWVNLHGHGNPYIAQAIAKQAKTMEHVMFDTFTHQPATALAKQLVKLAGNPFKKVFYSDNGSTAVEVALKMAIQFWHNQQKSKPIIIAFKDAYHGDTFGSMSVGARNIFNRAFEPYLFDVKYIDVPVENKTNSIKQFKTILKEYKNNIAAFVFEPLVLGASGMIMYLPETLDELILLAKKNNILCIADEVMTGFGRTGKWFATHYLKNKPDIMAISKGITGGFMPLGATLCTQEVFNAFLNTKKSANNKTFFHGHSYTANPIACAAANASMDLLKNKNCLKQITAIKQQHEKFIKKIQHHKNIAKAEVTGTILAVRIKSNSNGYLNPLREKIYPFFLERNIILRPLGNVIYVLPPYIIKPSELALIYNAIEDFLETGMSN